MYVMIKVLVADDHAVVREGLKQILAETPGMVVADEASNGRELLEKVWTRRFDVVVLDISMPGGDALEIVKQLKRQRPELPILVFSMHSEEQYAVRFFKAGVSGYLTKGGPPEELVLALQKVSKGGKYVTSSIGEKLVSELTDDLDKPPHETLSDREYEVFCRIAAGKTVREIGNELCLSPKTISTYRTRVLKKMRMRTNAELMRYAFKHTLVE
jgi:two-component system invasion response regulator UvrY